MNFKIRLGTVADIQVCRDICILTAAANRRQTEKQRTGLYMVYSDPYTTAWDTIWFVAENEKGEVIGYIFCAPDTISFCRKTLAKSFLPLFKKSPIAALLMAGEYLVYCIMAIRYPAHMHIDILDGYQRQGLGTEMVKTMLTELNRRKIKALFLITDTGNQKGPPFYQKYGFTLLHNWFGALVYGMDL